MFVSVLVLTGIALGTAEKFISISAHQAALQYDYAPEVVGMFCVHLIDDGLFHIEYLFISTEWLLVSHGIVQAIFAVLIAYWGNRVHKIKWLSSMLFFLTTAGLILIISSLVHA